MLKEHLKRTDKNQPDDYPVKDVMPNLGVQVVVENLIELLLE